MSDGLSATDAGLSGDGTDSPVKPAAGRLQPRAYVLLMLLIPALFVASAIPIARSDSFPVESGDPFILNADYAFSLKHVNCDVVIYGDSTALTGLDPTVVERSTGLKTCNIAQAQSILHILGMLALDTYLKNNTPPRYIVMQFAPETLSRGRSDFFWPEGLTLLLRKRSLLEALPTLLKHPVQAYYFSIWAIKAKVTSLTRLPIDFAATEAVFRAHRGLLTLPKPPQTGCLNNLAYARPTVEWVRGLKDKYGNQGTRVVVNVSPLPACSPIVPRVAAETRNVTDNTLSVFPIGLFCDLDRHLTLEGAERASLELAEQLVPGSGGSGRVN